MNNYESPAMATKSATHRVLTAAPEVSRGRCRRLLREPRQYESAGSRLI